MPSETITLQGHIIDSLILPKVMDEIVDHLYNREIDGAVIIDDEIMGRISEYRKIYGGELL